MPSVDLHNLEHRRGVVECCTPPSFWISSVFVLAKLSKCPSDQTGSTAAAFRSCKVLLLPPTFPVSSVSALAKGGPSNFGASPRFRYKIPLNFSEMTFLTRYFCFLDQVFRFSRLNPRRAATHHCHLSRFALSKHQLESNPSYRVEFHMQTCLTFSYKFALFTFCFLCFSASWRSIFGKLSKKELV